MTRKNIIGMSLLALFAILTAACKSTPKQPENAEANKEEAVTDKNRISDFSMNTPDGQPVAIMDEIKTHQITIIDFWASWCGPCIREVPNLVDLYKKYHDKGLGIIGISLDSEEESWKNAIKELNLSWTHLSDLNGWDNAAAKSFNVRAIPYTLVVDQKGNILKKGLTGTYLTDFIRSQFAE